MPLALAKGSVRILAQSGQRAKDWQPQQAGSEMDESGNSRGTWWTLFVLHGFFDTYREAVLWVCCQKKINQYILEIRSWLKQCIMIFLFNKFCITFDLIFNLTSANISLKVVNNLSSIDLVVLDITLLKNTFNLSTR